MNGAPVWLASLSWRRYGAIVPTDEWAPSRRKRLLEHLRDQLRGVGDPARERAFRMCSTLCIHRALSKAEELQLPASWWTEPAVDLAGGSLEILYERGCASPLSTRPCHNPTREPISPANPKLYFPLDCGDCPPCRARAACAPRDALLVHRE